MDAPLEKSAQLLIDASLRGAHFLRTLDDRSVAPPDDALAELVALDRPFPDGPTDAQDVLDRLDALGSPAATGNAGGRYFGFVVGGALPATVGANALAAAWDQCAGMGRMSPMAAKFERVAARWLLDALRLPEQCAVGFTTGATMANFCGMVAARHALLAQAGWDVEARGLFGAPEIPVVVGEEVHASALKALALVGFGRERVIRVPIDEQGRMRPEAFPTLDAPALVLIQAGNVNSGAFDDARAICERAHAARSWVHVDGAFGLWARAAQPDGDVSRLGEGLELADSWSVDGHKWLNVPYDSGIVICRHPDALHDAIRARAPYLLEDTLPDPCDATPEMSRRPRGLEVWAALASLGRSGVAELIARCCRHARRFADGLAAAGHEVLNDVVLNQVLVAFGDDARTDAVIEAIQRDGTCWCGGTTWRGRRAMRISVASWVTSEDDVERSLAAMLRVAAE